MSPRTSSRKMGPAMRVSIRGPLGSPRISTPWLSGMSSLSTSWSQSLEARVEPPRNNLNNTFQDFGLSEKESSIKIKGFETFSSSKKTNDQEQARCKPAQPDEIVLKNDVKQLKRHKCPTCSRGFRFKTHLKWHRATHKENSPPTQCPVCNTSFMNHVDVGPRRSARINNQPGLKECCHLAMRKYVFKRSLRSEMSHSRWNYKF